MSDYNFSLQYLKDRVYSTRFRKHHKTPAHKKQYLKTLWYCEIVSLKMYDNKKSTEIDQDINTIINSFIEK